MDDIEQMNKNNADILGLQTWLFQTQEECAELIKAISKYNRTRGIGQKTEAIITEAESNLIVEIADVGICLEQLTYLMECTSEVKYCKNKAIKKVNDRCKEEKCQK